MINKIQFSGAENYQYLKQNKTNKNIINKNIQLKNTKPAFDTVSFKGEEEDYLAEKISTRLEYKLVNNSNFINKFANALFNKFSEDDNFINKLSDRITKSLITQAYEIEAASGGETVSKELENLEAQKIIYLNLDGNDPAESKTLILQSFIKVGEDYLKRLNDTTNSKNTKEAFIYASEDMLKMINGEDTPTENIKKLADCYHNTFKNDPDNTYHSFEIISGLYFCVAVITGRDSEISRYVENKIRQFNQNSIPEGMYA